MPSQRNARTICTKQYGRASVVHAIVRQSSPSLTVPCAPPTSGRRRCQCCSGCCWRSRWPAAPRAGAHCAARTARDPGPGRAHGPGRDCAGGPGPSPCLSRVLSPFRSSSHSCHSRLPISLRSISSPSPCACHLNWAENLHTPVPRFVGQLYGVRPWKMV